MANRIVLKKGTTAGAAPSAINLVAGELAVNTTDGGLFTKLEDGSVHTLVYRQTEGLPITRGGTGLITAPGTLQLLVGQTGGAYALRTLTAGANVTITEAGGNLTIASTGGSAGSGDLVGPASATDNALVRFDTTTGKLVQNSGALLDDSNNLSGLTSVTATTFTGALTGNASTATTLQTARTINGVSFNGSADITVTAAAGTLTGTTLASNVTGSSLTSVGTLTNLTVTNTITGSITGNAGTVTNGLYSTGSYANPSWLTSLAGSKITGDITGNAANVTGTVAIAKGGTGLTTAPGALQLLVGQSDGSYALRTLTAGSNVTITDNGSTLTVASSGGGSGSGSGTATVSATAPSSPVEGTLWYDTTEGALYIYLSSTWVGV